MKDAAIDAANENREDRFQFERVGNRHFLALSSIVNGAPYYLDVAQIISISDINLPDGKIGSDVTLANGRTTSVGEEPGTILKAMRCIAMHESPPTHIPIHDRLTGLDNFVAVSHIARITEFDGVGSHVHISTGDVLETGLTILGISLLMTGRGCVDGNDARKLPEGGAIIGPSEELIEV
jgi:hypothetical protein